MKSYSPKIKCRKCGGDDIGSSYQKRGHYGCAAMSLPWDGEHIDRRCRRCGYEWAEGVLR